MKALCIILCCIILVGILGLPQNDCASSVVLLGRQIMRDLDITSPMTSPRTEGDQLKVLRGVKVNAQSSRIPIPGSSNDNPDDLVYHIDYHGVTTHPTPTPRHPKP